MPQLSTSRKVKIAARTLKNIITGKPITVSFEVTYNCQADCKHCDLGKGRHFDEERLSPEHFAKWVTELRPAVCQISGGEPLLRKDIYDIIEAMRKRDATSVFVITTNVQILNEERYLKLREAGVDQFSLSLDYPDERQNEFRALKNNFEHMSELLPKLAGYGNNDLILACVVQSDNFLELPKIAELAKKWGVAVNFSTYNHLRTGNTDMLVNTNGNLSDLNTVVDKLVMMQSDGYPILTSEWTMRRMIRFFQRGKAPRCRAGTRFMIVNPQAVLTPCGMFRDTYESRQELIDKFARKNKCEACFTAIRANSEKSPYRLLVDALGAVRRQQ